MRDAAGVVMKRSDRELDLEQKREREEEAGWRAGAGRVVPSG